ncbi:hypothetical protein JKP88DRAFT_168620, partial [Tribonema minus]
MKKECQERGNAKKRLLKCQAPGCNCGPKGSSLFCVKHGGGTRCSVLGCGRGAISNGRCVAHGGGPRCLEVRCGNGATARSEYCVTHGGRRRCLKAGCSNGAQGGSDSCTTPGGGQRCEPECCSALPE